MWETPHVCLNFYESVLYVAKALGWVSHVWQQTAGELHLVVPGLLQGAEIRRRAMPTCTSTSLPEKSGSAVSGFEAIRKRPLARRCGTRDERGNDTHDGDPYEEHNMGGLRVQRGMRTAHEDVIDMWKGIIDADHEGEQREDNRSKENCRVLRGTLLLVLSRRWLLPSC